MNVLVTGGAGFIGSHLCERLLNDNNIVYCLDNHCSSSVNNIVHLLNHKNFHYVNHDIQESFFINKLDQIYHLACPASPKYYQSNPIKTIKTNILGTLNVLGLARKHKANILLTSTSEIYGNPLKHPQDEEYCGNVNTLGIRACYDEGKRLAETLFMEYHRTHNVNTKIARIFNTYGPQMQQDDGRVVTNFIKQALTNKDITIYGDGKQTRSLCYIDDMINGLIKLMNSEIHTPINLGNTNEITILELAEKIITLTNSRSKLNFSKLPEDDPLIRKPDIEKAKRYLNWEPTIKLEEGLNSTIKYLKQKLYIS